MQVLHSTGRSWSRGQTRTNRILWSKGQGGGVDQGRRAETSEHGWSHCCDRDSGGEADDGTVDANWSIALWANCIYGTADKECFLCWAPTATPTTSCWSQFWQCTANPSSLQVLNTIRSYTYNSFGSSPPVHIPYRFISCSETSGGSGMKHCDVYTGIDKSQWLMDFYSTMASMLLIVETRSGCCRPSCPILDFTPDRAIALYFSWALTAQHSLAQIYLPAMDLDIWWPSGYIPGFSVLLSFMPIASKTVPAAATVWFNPETSFSFPFGELLLYAAFHPIPTWTH